MTVSALYEKFEATNCSLLTVNLHPHLGRGAAAKVRGCVSGKRRRAPYFFGKAIPGEGKEKIGVSASLSPVGTGRFCLQIHWFPTAVDPPPDLGHFDRLAECFGGKLEDSEGLVTAEFHYAKDRFGSFFKPISLPEQPSIFDEIVGLTGIKKGPEGKILYRLEVSIEEKHVAHRVVFTRSMKLSDDLPLQLLDAAHSVSALALAPKEAV